MEILQQGRAQENWYGVCEICGQIVMAFKHELSEASGDGAVYQIAPCSNCNADVYFYRDGTDEAESIVLSIEPY